MTLDRARLTRALHRAQTGPPERLAALESLVGTLLIGEASGPGATGSALVGSQASWVRGDYSGSFDREGGQTG